MERHKVCFVVSSPLTIRFFLFGHIRSISKKYDLTIITDLRDPSFLADLSDTVRIIPLNIERKISFWRDIRALFRLILIFSRENFSAVQSFSPKAGLLSIVAGWITGVPCRVHTFQGEVWATKTGILRLVLRKCDELIGFLASDLIVVSKSEERFLVSHGIVDPGRMRILGSGSICGVNLERFHPDVDLRLNTRSELSITSNQKVITYVGRLTIDKGVLDLADAFLLLLKKIDNVILLFVGPEEDVTKSQLINRLGNFASRAVFVDYSSRPEKYMVSSDILCLPSYREGFGLVLSEAAACGIPTIGSDIYGITDALIDNVTGLLFKPGDIDDLAEKISILLADPDYAQSLAYNGMMRVRREFSSDLIEREFMNFYEEILS